MAGSYPRYFVGFLMANHYHKYVRRVKSLGISESWLHTENSMLPLIFKEEEGRNMTPLECIESGGEFECTLEDLIVGMERKSK